MTGETLIAVNLPTAVALSTLLAAVVGSHVKLVLDNAEMQRNMRDLRKLLGLEVTNGGAPHAAFLTTEEHLRQRNLCEKVQSGLREDVDQIGSTLIAHGAILGRIADKLDIRDIHEPGR